MNYLSFNLDNFMIIQSMPDSNNNHNNITDKHINLKKYNSQPFIICNYKNFLDITKQSNIICADIMELFVFLYPNASCSSNIFSIYKYLSKEEVYKEKNSNLVIKQEVELLRLCVEIILSNLNNLPVDRKNMIYELAFFMQKDNWYFAKLICDILEKQIQVNNSKNPMNIWNYLADFKEDINFDAIDNEVDFLKINSLDVLNSYEKIVSQYAETREEQKNYAESVAQIFTHDYTQDNKQQFIFAEAGTGIGKTIGYLSGVFAFLNHNPNKQVLISTYSKALQKQVLSQVEKIIKNNSSKLSYCLAKGSNNYICLLNYETLLNNIALLPRSYIFLGFIAHWLLDNKDGDLIGGNLNPLLFEIFDDNYINFILNKKDECIYSKCKHFKKCFAIKSKFQSKNSNIVVANHSYSIINSGLESSYAIFDEAHHLFNSADDAFAIEFSITTLSSLKSWICGGKTRLAQSKFFLNGIKAKLNFTFNITPQMDEEEKLLSVAIENTIDLLVEVCEFLPQKNSLENILSNFVGSNASSCEKFFMEIYNHILEYNKEENNYYSKELEVDYTKINANIKLEEARLKLIKDLTQLLKMAINLDSMLNNKMIYLENEDKKALSELIVLFETRVISQLNDFIKMLEEIKKPDIHFIYRFNLAKEDGRLYNIAYLKNHINPMQPFAYSVLNHMQGVVFTSATLHDSHMEKSAMLENDYNPFLIKNYGLDYLENPFDIKQVNFSSPFDYPNNSKVLIINSNDNMDLSQAIKEIFSASSGGGLAIFTAISRLKKVYNDIKNPMLNQGIKVVAQHINQQKLVNLIDIFKEDINSCLLGTDSARDGIDIPGESLKLVLFEKVPWSKPDILLKHRVISMGGKYADELVKYKLRQAFGRLIRKKDDRGIFIILANSFPSKFLDSFPVGVEVLKLNLNDALEKIKEFY
jgi:ATP-dependent DNA helicase DinG